MFYRRIYNIGFIKPKAGDLASPAFFIKVKVTTDRFAPLRRGGFFLALEGIDGCGKTTQAFNVCRVLAAAGFDPLYVKEPTSGVWGRKIRQIAENGRLNLTLEEEMDYFVRDRAEDVALNIAPALAQDRVVVADRYIASNIAYQSALGLDSGRIIAANANFPWPDLHIVLDIPVEAALARIRNNRGETPNQGYEDQNFLIKVKAEYDRLKMDNIIRINSDLNEEDITEKILDLIITFARESA